MKILVTGGAGFIGGNYVQRYASNDRSENSRVGVPEIKVVDFLGVGSDKAKIPPGVLLDIIDIRDIAALRESVLSFNPEVIIHFAAESHVCRSIEDSDPFMSSNVIGTRNILEILRKDRPQILLVNVSTDEVYGSLNHPDLATEEKAIEPGNPYAASKAAAEAFCGAYANTYGLKVVTTRCCNNYGMGQHEEKFIPKVIRQLKSGGNLTIAGDGKQVRQWIHVDDHNDGLAAVLNWALGHVVPGKAPTFNVADYNFSTIFDLGIKILHILGFDESKIEYIPDRPGQDRRYAISSSKTRALTSWTPKIKFEHGLEAAVKAYWNQCSENNSNGR